MRPLVCFALLFLSAGAFADPCALGFPKADLGVDDLVPLDLVSRIAQKKAEAAWGEVSLGPPIPYCDLQGKIKAYAFGISKGWPGFPDYDRVVAGVEEARRLGAQDLRWGIGEYGSIVVSARYSEIPIPEFSNCLPRYYTTGYLARKVAARILGSPDPPLTRIYYEGPLFRLFEFNSGEKRVLVDPYSLTTYPAEVLSSQLPLSEETLEVKELNRSSWAELQEVGPAFTRADTFVVEGVPAFLWSYGCSPTSSAMLFAYWDTTQYGKLVDYYFDHQDVIVGFVANMPNVQQELAVAMHTDTINSGRTWTYYIASGHTTVANVYHDYSFGAQCSPEGGSGNDWNWNWITSEIDGERPLHWCGHYYYGGQWIDHSVAAFGYTTDKYVIIHNTWDYGTHYWYYQSGGAECRMWVVTLVPGGGNPNNVLLTRPTSGEHFLGGLKGLITWNSTGGGIDHMGLQYSLDNTQTWQDITTSTPNSGSYVWQVPSASSDSVRVKIEAYTGGNSPLAADGSYERTVIFTVTDALNVSAVGYSDAIGEATDLAVSSGYAYLCCGVSGLRIFDCSDPTLPIEVGCYDTDDQAYSVFVVDSLAYVADVAEGLRIINCSDPTNPAEISGLDTPDRAYGVYVSGSFAYVADRTSGLRVIDVSDPANPSEEGFCDTPGLAWDVWVTGDHAYVADLVDGLVVVNVGDPNNPYIEGNCDTPGRAYGVHVADTLAYVADYEHGVQAIDISDPTGPSIVGSHDTDGSAWRVWVEQGYIYVADGSDGLRVLGPDLTEIGHYNTHHDAKGVCSSASCIWVADGRDGLYVLSGPPFGVKEVQEARSQKQEARLFQNRPNPFGAGGTTIQFRVQNANCKIRLKVYDLAGRLVRVLADEALPTSYSLLPTSVVWDAKDSLGRDAAAGVYLYRLEAGTHVETRKMVLVR